MPKEEEEHIGFDYADPDNVLLLDLFYLAHDQLLIGANGPISLNLAVMPLLFEVHEITDPFDKRWLLQDLKALVAGYIGEA